MKKNALFGISLLIFCCSVYCPPVRADWINLTGAQSAPNIAEIYVEDDRVRLLLEVYVGDLDKFVDLLPDDWFKDSDVKPPPIEERIRRFSEETLQIIFEDENSPDRYHPHKEYPVYPS